MTASKKERLKNLFKSLLQQGLSPGKLALTAGVGAALGVFPIVGATTLLCALAAVLLRLNHPTIQLVNYAVYPLQLILMGPFYATGMWLFDRKTEWGAVQEILAVLKNDFGAGLVALWDLTVYAVLVWVLISPIIVLSLFAVLKPIIAKLLPAKGEQTDTDVTAESAGNEV